VGKLDFVCFGGAWVGKPGERVTGRERSMNEGNDWRRAHARTEAERKQTGWGGGSGVAVGLAGWGCGCQAGGFAWLDAGQQESVLHLGDACVRTQR
jgi:hypothetical protein